MYCFREENFQKENYTHHNTKLFVLLNEIGGQADFSLLAGSTTIGCKTDVTLETYAVLVILQTLLLIW